MFILDWILEYLISKILYSYKPVCCVIVNIVMETSDFKINEKCGYDILNRELK